MVDRLGLGKQTNLFRARLLGWLYHHDWQLAGVLAVATIAAAAFVLWPRPDPAAARGAPAGISADDVEAAQERALQSANVQRALDGRRVARAVYVPDRLINLVTE